MQGMANLKVKETKVVVGREPRDSETFGDCDFRDATAALSGQKDKVPLDDLAEHAVMMRKPYGATVLRSVSLQTGSFLRWG